MMAARSQLDPASSSFVDEVCDWLLVTKDPRLTITAKGARIDNMVQACADFCGLMAEVCEAGYEAKHWREYLRAKEAA
jgi:hypothetical protein